MAHNPFRSFVNFLRLLRRMPPDPGQRYRPDTTQIRDAARASFSPRGGGHGISRGATTGSRQTDKMIGKAIADSHKKSRH